jgi:hypothetical protein
MQRGDAWRDTMVLTVRGDGVDLPPYFIISKSKTASYASGRRPRPGEEIEKGMTKKRMMQYIDFIKDYVQEPCVLLMDRHSAHTSSAVLDYIRAYRFADGTQVFHPKLLGTKTAFLISPLDMGAIGAMKHEFYKLDRSRLDLKLRAALQAWATVSNDNICHFFRNCGLVGSEELSSIRSRFEKEVRSGIPPQYEELWDLYDGWRSGSLHVEGATLGRGIPLELPEQLPESALDGKYWCNYGPHGRH